MYEMNELDDINHKSSIIHVHDLFDCFHMADMKWMAK